MPARLGAVLRAAREARKLSVSEVSTRSGVSRAMIDEIERGKNVSVDTVEKVAKALGVERLPLGAASLDITDAAAAHVRELAERIEREAAEIAAAVSVESPEGSVLKFPDRRITITFAEEQESDAMRDAINNAPKSMVQWRVGYRAEPTKHLVQRKGRAAAGHGVVPTDSDEARRQIPEHYWSELGARDPVVLVGDSLVDLGYVDHDLLFVRPLAGAQPQNNDIIVCQRSADEGILVKVFATEHGQRWLLSANERESKRYPSIKLAAHDELQVFGVVVGRSGYALPGSLAPRPQSKQRMER